ncbi:hypothetical protein D3C79_844070 [compost metagenome]
MLGYFVAGEVGFAVGLELFQADPAFTRHDKEFHRFAGAFVRDADHCAVGHLWMTHDHFFDLVRVHVEARDNDHVFLAIDDPGKAIRVDHGDVTGLEPTLAIERLGSRLRMLPVALHHLRALDAQLATFAHRQFMAFIVDDLEPRTRYRDTHCPQARQLAVRVGAGYRRGFGQAIAFHNAAASQAFPAFSSGGNQGGATGVGNFQR